MRRDFSVLALVINGAIDRRNEDRPNSDHLRETMSWLCRAQDAAPAGGVSGAYDIVANRWYPAYPETTGYIIPTFYDYSVFSGDESYRDRARRMAEWLLSLQLENGAFPGPPWLDSKSQPYVFDTGQIIHGLLRAYGETDDSRFMAAARQAGDWLAMVQEEDGSWHKFDMDYSHVYNSRTAWALLCIDEVENSSRYRWVAMKNLDWILCQQEKDGWFDHAAFDAQGIPLTHTLAYTIEGLLETGLLLSDPGLIDSARRAADVLRRYQEDVEMLPGTFGAGWQPVTSWSCLTGNAQMAIIWMRLYELTKEPAYLMSATAANHHIKQIQSLNSPNPGIRGGISGSYPIYGEYGHYLFLNWAAKFFADSLMLAERILADEGIANSLGPTP